MKNIIYLIIGLNLLFSSCDKKKEKADLIKITIAQTSDFFLYAPLYIAKDAKIFEKHGLDVTILNTGGDEKTWASVISGDASFGVSDPTFVILTDKRGQSGKVIANLVNGVPFWGITYDKSIKPFKNFYELDGYSVATFPSPSTAYSLQKEMFNSLHLKPNIREGAFGTLIPMLKANQADIALELEPNVSQAIKNNASIVYSMSELYGDFCITGLSTSDDYIAKNPELVQKVVCSMQDALNYINIKTDSTVVLLKMRFPEISDDVSKNAIVRLLHANIIPKNLIIKDKAWNAAVDLRIKVGDIENPKPITSYVNNIFAIKSINNNCK